MTLCPRRLVHVVVALAILGVWTCAAPYAESDDVQFVFTSDAHYGILRSAFQGESNVAATVVNAAMIAKINTLPAVSFPMDDGLQAGDTVGPMNFLVEGGDIANRQEGTGAHAIQRAAVSWSQFKAEYIDGLTVTDRAGHKAPLYIVPGNHEVSNAIGYYHTMTPPIDKTAMVEIYNRMMSPAVAKTTATYEYARDRVLFSRDVGGVHFEFITVWPDSGVRAWMEKDLAPVTDSTPVIIFAHDEPDAESKHFKNPNGRHDINEVDKFENLLSDKFADGRTVDRPSVIEQITFERFLKRHANITAYFHGNSNWNQFYDWTGPDHAVALHTFRVDSPMKGAVSSKDETRLSFHVVTIDAKSRLMTVRECLWDIDPTRPSAPVAWGASTTVSLQPPSSFITPMNTRTSSSLRRPPGSRPAPGVR